MNFEVVLFILLVVAGFFWICDRLYFRKLREEGEDRPAFLEYTAGFFPDHFDSFYYSIISI